MQDMIDTGVPLAGSNAHVLAPAEMDKPAPPFILRVSERLGTVKKKKADLLRATNTSWSMWRKYGAGSKPGRARLKRFAKFLETTPEELWPGYDEDEDSEGEEAEVDELAAAIDAYLHSELGQDCKTKVAQYLRAFDFESVGLHHPGVKDIHRAREFIEINLAMSRNADK